MTLLLIILLGCRKDQWVDDPSAKLNFSADTVIFDTVFTTVSTVTKRLKVFNPYNQPFKIDKIMLAGGKNSPFRINVDGMPGDATGVVIDAKDSIYIFIEATIDPVGSNYPLIVEDSILFFHHNSVQQVKLVAWGQDAIYYTPNQYIPGLPPFRILPCNTTWSPMKPIVVYGYVVVDSNCVLNILPGTKVYFHSNSGLWVYKGGTINAVGTKDDPIVFRNDRLEHQYDDIPGQWDRIWINESSNDQIFENVQIVNSFIGIQAEPLPFGNDADIVPSNTLILKNVKILHTTIAGLYVRNYNVTAGNLLIADNGQHSIVWTGGGTGNFTHTTIANYWNISTRNTVSCYVSNEYTDIYGVKKNNFNPIFNVYNSIIWGNLNNELLLENKGQGSVNATINNNVLKTTIDLNAYNSQGNLKNPSGELFKDYTKYDFHLQTNSPAINLGNIIYTLPDWQKDMDDNDRTTDGQPDAGCYEYQP